MTEHSADLGRASFSSASITPSRFLLPLPVLLFLDQRGRADAAGDDAGSGHLRAVRPEWRCARTISIPACRQPRTTPSPRSTSLSRSSSPTTCTPNITRSAPSAPATGIRPICSWAALMTVLVLEYSRKRHMPLFVLNIVLILYAVYGYLVPGMFYHAGLSWCARRDRHERRDHDRRVLQPAADRAHGDRRVPAGAERAERLWLHRIAAARDQARRDPLAARAAAVGGGRLDVRRHRERQRRGQRHHHRLGHHSRHDRRRHAARDRGGDRSRRPRSAAS